MPDLAKYFSLKNTSIREIFDLRVKSRNIRKFINEIEHTSTIDFYKEYRDRLDKQYSFLNNKSYKILRMTLTNVILSLGFILDTSEVIGLTENTINKLKPTIRLQDIYV